MFECFDTNGEKIRRVGVASVKRVLNNPVNITDVGEDVWATVSCPDAGVYINQFDKFYDVSWFHGDELYEEVYKNSKEAINRFLKLRQDGIKCSE